LVPCGPSAPVWAFVIIALHDFENVTLATVFTWQPVVASPFSPHYSSSASLRASAPVAPLLEDWAGLSIAHGHVHGRSLATCLAGVASETLALPRLHAAAAAHTAPGEHGPRGPRRASLRLARPGLRLLSLAPEVSELAVDAYPVVVLHSLAAHGAARGPLRPLGQVWASVNVARSSLHGLSEAEVDVNVASPFSHLKTATASL